MFPQLRNEIPNTQLNWGGYFGKFLRTLPLSIICPVMVDIKKSKIVWVNFTCSNKALCFPPDSLLICWRGCLYTLIECFTFLLSRKLHDYLRTCWKLSTYWIGIYYWLPRLCKFCMIRRNRSAVLNWVGHGSPGKFCDKMVFVRHGIVYVRVHVDYWELVRNQKNHLRMNPMYKEIGQWHSNWRFKQCGCRHISSPSEKRTWQQHPSECGRWQWKRAH